MSEWISVEKDLPDSCGMPANVFVYTTYQNTMSALFMEGQFTLVTVMDGLSNNWECYGNITHWMPLPAPPSTPC